ncbi:MAG: glycosyltransferase [Ardenticatenaceae bacterium]|nr:glycosyltransferase [Ardenticatenaceae bacterium]MCB9442671.1 glycosyltransferase [Ardenticatenaceae bacterium]
MKLSVIIPCYNAESTISEQLDALLQQKISDPWEIIIADNRSNDNSRAVIESYVKEYPNVRVIDAFDRQGPSHARNVGVQAAQGEILVFCDADDVVAPGWLAALRSSLDEFDLAVCRIDTKELNQETWVSRLEWGEDDTAVALETLEDHRASYPPHLILVRGWGFAIKREFHEAIHGFDETMTAGEDLDYGFRAQIAGARPTLAYDALLYYRYRPQFKAMMKQWQNYGKHTVLLRKKYEPKEASVGFWRSWTKYFVGWAKLIWWLLKTRKKEEFALVMRNGAFRIGTLQGCLQYRLNPHE